VTRAILRDWDVRIDTPSQLIPAADGQVRPGKAEFYWATVPGIDSYLVTIVSADGEEITRTVRDHRLVLSGLTPGEEYVWKVQPSVEGWQGESRWRAFTVMGVEEERRLDEAIAGVDNLGAGVLLLSAGLHEEAIYRFDAAVADASQERSARMWRAQAMAEVGLYRSAYQDVLETSTTN